MDTTGKTIPQNPEAYLGGRGGVENARVKDKGKARGRPTAGAHAGSEVLVAGNQGRPVVERDLVVAAQLQGEPRVSFNDVNLTRGGRERTGCKGVSRLVRVGRSGERATRQTCMLHQLTYQHGAGDPGVDQTQRLEVVKLRSDLQQVDQRQPLDASQSQMTQIRHRCTVGELGGGGERRRGKVIANQRLSAPIIDKGANPASTQIHLTTPQTGKQTHNNNNKKKKIAHQRRP